MRKPLAVGGVAVVVTAALSIGLGQAQDRRDEDRGLIFASADEANFMEVVPGVSKAVLWGDHEEGPYGAFTRFVADFDGGMHTHTHDVWIVGIEGAYRYKDDAGEKRVGPGDFIFVPAGTKHWSGGDAADGAVFYEESSGGFDLVPAGG